MCHLQLSIKLVVIVQDMWLLHLINMKRYFDLQNIYPGLWKTESTVHMPIYGFSGYYKLEGVVNIVGTPPQLMNKTYYYSLH